MTTCPCQSTKNYADCCGVFISDQASPKTPEQLMRSRYTAYTQANIDYIIRTMKDKAAKNFDPTSAAKWAQESTWLGLKVIRSETKLPRGFVEFMAYYELNNKKQTLHELSEFILEDGQWYYINGTTPTPGRNDLCPCGSGKKFKKCCLTTTTPRH